MNKTMTTMLAALVLAGCAHRPTQAEADNADYGSYPTKAEDIVHAYYNRVLKDPGSAQYQEIPAPRKFWYAGRFKEATYGYLTCVTYNAKNSYGGYVGFKTDGVIIRNGQVVDVFEGGQRFGMTVC